MLLLLVAGVTCSCTEPSQTQQIFSADKNSRIVVSKYPGNNARDSYAVCVTRDTIQGCTRRNSDAYLYRPGQLDVRWLTNKTVRIIQQGGSVFQFRSRAKRADFRDDPSQPIQIELVYKVDTWSK